jgi:hypothetical protein
MTLTRDARDCPGPNSLAIQRLPLASRKSSRLAITTTSLRLTCSIRKAFLNVRAAIKPDVQTASAPTADVSTCVGNMTTPTQKDFIKLLKGLLHFKKGAPKYSIDHND